jgi:polysaccharide export outer membrane protein
MNLLSYGRLAVPQLIRRWAVEVSALAVLALFSGCSSLPTSGPSSKAVAEEQASHGIPIIDVDAAVARQVLAADKQGEFSALPSPASAPGYVVGPGDMLEVSVWEAPPATLFGTGALDPRTGIASTQVTTLPQQMVSAEGTINVPFAGEMPVTGMTPQKIEAEIVRRLAGKANQPQVLVRVTSNVTSNVTVVGEVAQSVRMPLTAKGERLLDALAASGGVRQPVGKMTIQLSRGGQVMAMPLDSIIQDPKQNIVLRPGDVVTALFQPLSFTALGATGGNAEVNFEAKGISLAQALGRIGGVQDMRADARGVFIFRFEDPAALPDDGKGLPRTPEGRIPVVYRVDLTDPRTFLVAQSFPVRNRDVLYVANAPAAELQKFLNIVTTSLYSITTLKGL